MQGKNWCFTINNPNETVRDVLASLHPTTAKYVVFGNETGDSGTPHLQGYIQFNTNQRLLAAKAHLGGTCHLSLSRGTPEQASAYCKKDGDYQEFGEITVRVKKVAPLDAFIEYIKQLDHRPSERELIAEFPKLMLLYGKRVWPIIDGLLPVPVFLDQPAPRAWQSDLELELQGEPDDRSVFFYVDPEGEKGKSWFVKYMLQKKPDEVQFLKLGKREDLAYAIDPTKRIFLFDIPRGGMEFVQYTVFEQLKDRLVFSSKYESQTKILHKQPHVVVFCNEDPDMNKMSIDRYSIRNYFNA